MKRCSRCKIEKSLGCFAKNRTRKDGLQHYCRECKTILKKKYLKTEACKESNRRYKQSCKGKESVKRYDEKARRTHPEKYEAHYKAANAEKKGLLIRQPCEICGEVDVQKHHEDYSKPLDIEWLCKKCHQKKEKK